MNDAQQKPRGLFRSIGPAVIVASVVIGPGSILTASKVGAQYGYGMIWVLLGSCVLMVGMVALAAGLGVSLDRTPCEELARRLGRPVAAVVGISIFLIASSFQFGNNLGVLAALEPFVEPAAVEQAGESPDARSIPWWAIGTLVLVNGLILVALFGKKGLYQLVEPLMTFLVMLMVIGFAANLLFARPSLAGIVRGAVVPRLPGDAGSLQAAFLPLLGMVATTFSVAGAFYQAYLVREKGWTVKNLRQGLTDSVVGTTVLFFITLMILATSAAVLHQQVQAGTLDPAALTSAADVARQLEPLFGRAAVALFCMGIFAGAFSSFLVNSMIGGSMLSDGLGLGGKMDEKWPKVFTTLALLMGMTVAIGVKAAGFETVNLIIFAQAVTVLGLPAIALAMLYLATRPEMTAERQVPLWVLLLAVPGFYITLALAARTVLSLYERFAK